MQMDTCLWNSSSSTRRFKAQQCLKLLFQSFKFSNSLLTTCTIPLEGVVCVRGSCPFVAGTFLQLEAGGMWTTHNNQPMLPCSGQDTHPFWPTTQSHLQGPDWCLLPWALFPGGPLLVSGTSMGSGYDHYVVRITGIDVLSAEDRIMHHTA